MKRKLFTFFLALMASVGTMFASNVAVGGIWYDFNSSSKTVSVTYHGASYSSYINDYTGAVVIPATITYNGIVFRVTSIGKNAFRACEGLTSISLASSVESIGENAFRGCNELISIVIPNSVVSIGDSAFYNSNLKSVTIGDSVASIGKSAFALSYYLNSVTITNSVKSIGESAFEFCSAMKSMTIGDGVTTIGRRAFYGCSSSKSLTIGNSVTSIGNCAFTICEKLTSVTIPNSVTNIGDSAFFKCSSLTSVTFGDSVASIGDYAFSKCTGFTSVTIPSSITYIGQGAFNECNGMTYVMIEAETPPTISGSIVFYGLLYSNGIFKPANYPIYVPCHSVNAYKTAWSSYAKRIVGNCVSYSVAFVNWDGSNLQTISVTEGEMPEYTGNAPMRPSDEQYTYTFSGWTPTIVAATEDATYMATFDTIINSYTVSSNSIDGRVDGVGAYPYGTEVELIAIPNEGYIFSQWTDGIVDNPRSVFLTCDTTFTAIFVPAISADSIEVDNFIVTTYDSTANVEWPTVFGAATYELHIQDQNGNAIYTLVFNEEGLLISTIFNAPGRFAQQQIHSLGFSFLITGLEVGETYNLILTAKDENGNILNSKSISFVAGAGVHQDLDTIYLTGKKVRKLLRNGQILILRSEQTYTLTGAEIK